MRVPWREGQSLGGGERLGEEVNNTVCRSVRVGVSVEVNDPVQMHPKSVPKNSYNRTATHDNSTFSVSNLIFHFRFILTFDFFEICAWVFKRPDNIGHEMLDCTDISEVLPTDIALRHFPFR